jgi:LPXTG-motif cell wall-anchored protein
MNYKKSKNLIAGILVSFVLSVFFVGNVYADCESTYGNGEKCYINKRFEIEKKVRVEDEDDDWEDKVMNVAEDDVVEFRIRIKNKSDEDADDFDDMRMEDILPDEMYRVGGSGLTEYWDDFEPGETKTFYLEAQVEEDEYDRDEDFEKCVVNKAELEWDGEYEGSDTATVCYGEEEVKELPDTGSNEVIALLGVGLMAAGALLRKSLNFIV